MNEPFAAGRLVELVLEQLEALAQARGFALERFVVELVLAAVEDAGQMIKINPKDVDAWIWRSYIRSAAGDWAGGLQDATRLTELEPDEGSHWYRRGKLWFAQKEFRKALEDFRKAGELSPRLASELDPLIAQCRTKLGE